MWRPALLASILAVPGLLAQEPAAPPAVHPRLSEAATTAVDAGSARIRAELAGLGEPGWAGAYYRGDGLGVNVVVELAPAAGFVFRWSGCLGTYDQDHGTCAERDGRIELRSAFPAAPARHRLFAAELVPVRWGERRYLIPSDSLIGFANAVNDGSEPRDGPHGMFLLRDGDDKRPVLGRPELPETALAMLLAEPVTGTIAAVHESRIESIGTLRYRVTEATIDRGGEHGLKAGHAVHFQGVGFGVEGGNVVAVTAQAARIQIRSLMLEGAPKSAPEPQAGWKWSTRWR